VTGALYLLTGAGSPQAREKLLCPPGDWRTLTEVISSACLEKFILTAKIF